MKILLDECIPRKLKNSFPGHECQTVPEAGLAGQKNGLLLSLAEGAGFDLFITIDKGLQYQQNLAGPRHRNSVSARQIEPPRRSLAVRGSVPIANKLDPAR